MKVLIVDDDPVTRSLLKAFLHKWGYEVVIACGGTEAWELLQEPESPSIVVSDWIMPDMSGLDLCRKVRQAQAASYTYLIVLTGKGHKEDVVEAFEAGADDYLIKPFDQEELKYRIRTGERIIKLEQKILELAHTDFLTGVLNRRAFIQRMENEIHRSARKRAPISLILADIDHFKNIVLFQMKLGCGVNDDLLAGPLFQRINNMTLFTMKEFRDFRVDPDREFGPLGSPGFTVYFAIDVVANRFFGYQITLPFAIKAGFT